MARFICHFTLGASCRFGKVKLGMMGPGLNQRSAHAELHAALRALRWQNRSQTTMTLWVDAHFVCIGIGYILLHGVAGVVT